MSLRDQHGRDIAVAGADALVATVVVSWRDGMYHHSHEDNTEAPVRLWHAWLRGMPRLASYLAPARGVGCLCPTRTVWSLSTGALTAKTAAGIAPSAPLMSPCLRWATTLGMVASATSAR